MKFRTIFKLLPVAIFLVLYSCKKDSYIVGGSVHDVNMFKNTSTYDVLKTNALFDTLSILIDAAGIKDKINAQGTSFFAPTDYSIYHYLSQKTLYVQATIDQYGQFGLDSLVYYLKNNINHTADSMSMYLIGKPLTYDVLTPTGTLYPTQLSGDSAIVSYEGTKDPYYGYNPQVSNIPQLVYFTQLWKHFPVGPNNPIDSLPANTGVHTLVQTSGMLTQNGVMHVLSNSHTLFFYGTKR